MSKPPEFIYFDLGNVLLNFDHRRACRQLAAASGLSPERAWDVLIASGLNLRCDRGDLSPAEFHETFRREAGTALDFAAFDAAVSEIFEVNASLLPVVASLGMAYRIGVLSNTSEGHWNHVTDGRFGLLPGAFSVFALSFRLRVLKPEPAIYRAAADLAGVPPERIFYCDDIPENVSAARAAGFDAVRYTTTPELVADLRSRGVRFNY